MGRRGKQRPSDKNARVKVGKLAEKDKELKDVEAHNIRGGGGPSGGVNGDKSDQTTYRPA